MLSAIPASCVIYVQMRMIVCVAYMVDYELSSDQTQRYVYVCLASVIVDGVLKQVGMKFGVKFTDRLIKKIPRKVFIKSIRK